MMLFIAMLSLPVTNTHALEWVDYDGTIPDNAVSVNTDLSVVEMPELD